MANSEIAGLTEDTTPDSTDNVYVQDAAGAVDKRVPLSALPVSTATQTAIDAKVADAINNGTTTVAPSQNAVFDALALKAPLADPDFTGTVEATDSDVTGDVTTTAVVRHTPAAQAGTGTVLARDRASYDETSPAISNQAQIDREAFVDVDSAQAEVDVYADLGGAEYAQARLLAAIDGTGETSRLILGSALLTEVDGDGILRASGDLTVADEVYDATAWNGSVEVPTKNAVRDMHEAHLTDTAAAHAASAISIIDAANDFTATDVEGALAELQSDAEADATALSDHLADASDAHDASAISVLDTAAVYTATNVEDALNEVHDYVDDEIAALPDLQDEAQGRLVFTLGGSPPSETLTPSFSGVTFVVGKRAGNGTLTSSSAATSVLASTLTPAANSIAAGAVLKVAASGTAFNNTGSDQTWTFRFRLATGNLINVAVTLPASATIRAWRFQGEYLVSATPDVTGIGTLFMGGVTEVTDTIIRTEASAVAIATSLSSWSAFDITIQHGSNSINMSSSLASMVIEQAA